jgi:hypothetical protein
MGEIPAIDAPLSPGLPSFEFVSPFADGAVITILKAPGQSDLLLNSGRAMHDPAREYHKH